MSIKFTLLLPIILVLPPTQPITKNIILLVDVSGSMSHSGRPGRALSAVSQMTRQPIDEAAVLCMAWANHVTTDVAGWEKLPSEEGAARMEGWISAQQGGNGDTFLAPALKAALARPEKDLTIIIITDGELHNDTTEGLLATLKAGQAARGEKGPATVGVWQVQNTKEPKPTLLALAKAGGGGMVMEGESE